MSYSRIIPSHSKKNRHSIVHCSLSHLSGFSMVLYQNGTRTEPGRNQTSTRPVPDRYQKVHWPWNYNLMQKPTWVNWRDEKWNIHLKISVIFSRELLNKVDLEMLKFTAKLILFVLIRLHFWSKCIFCVKNDICVHPSYVN